MTHYLCIVWVFVTRDACLCRSPLCLSKGGVFNTIVTSLVSYPLGNFNHVGNCESVFQSKSYHQLGNYARYLDSYYYECVEVCDWLRAIT